MRWLLSLCLVGLLTTQAVGQVTDFTWTPASPVIGNLVSFSPVGGAPSGYVASAKWEYRYAATQPSYGGVHAPMAWSLGRNFSMAMPWQSNINLPGDWEVQLTVSYALIMPPGIQLPNTVIVKTVSAVPPDNVEVISGWNSPALFNQQIAVQYQIRRGTTPIGIMAIGGVQSRYVNQWQLPPLSPEHPADWPAGGLWYGGDWDFYRLGCHLFTILYLDAVDINAMAEFETGQAFYGYTMMLQWAWQSPYNESFTSSLGSVMEEWYKHDATKWGVREQ